MRLIVECEHGRSEAHPKSDSEGVSAMVVSTAGPREFDPSKLDWCYAAKAITDPDAILAALAEAGVLEVREFYDHLRYEFRHEYVSRSWKEAK